MPFSPAQSTILLVFCSFCLQPNLICHVSSLLHKNHYFLPCDATTTCLWFWAGRLSQWSNWIWKLVFGFCHHAFGIDRILNWIIALPMKSGDMLLDKTGSFKFPMERRHLTNCIGTLALPFTNMRSPGGLDDSALKLYSWKAGVFASLGLKLADAREPKVIGSYCLSLFIWGEWSWEIISINSLRL